MHKTDIQRSMAILTPALLLWAFAIDGCKPASEKPAASEQTSATQQESSASQTPNIVRPSSSPSTRQAKATPTASRTLAVEKEYLAATNADQKIEAVYKLGEIESKESVEAMGRLFRSEADADVKGEILNVLAVIDGATREKLAIYRLGVQAGQPDEVRKASIDGLGDLEDVHVIPILQELTKDPNSEISDAARDALEMAQSSLNSR